MSATMSPVPTTKIGEPKVEGSYSDLKTRGFVVIRNLLSEEELQEQIRQFEAAPQSTTKLYYSLSLSPQNAETLAKKLKPFLPSIVGEAGLEVNAISKGDYFITEKKAFAWHIDFQMFYSHQDFYNYVTFWIPLIKPDPKKSGVSLIPMDTLAERLPDVFRAAVGSGAASASRDGKYVFHRNDHSSTTIASSVSPDELAVSPELAPGDVLIFRGDLFHRTQDSDTNRVGLAVRVYNANGRSDLLTFLSINQKKYERYVEERFNFSKVLGAFVRHGSRQITLGQLNQYATDVDKRKPLAVATFALTYLWFPAVVRAFRLRSILKARADARSE
jgi:hypothetical protein